MKRCCPTASQTFLQAPKVSHRADCSIDLSKEEQPPCISTNTTGWLWSASGASKIDTNITSMDDINSDPSSPVTPTATMDLHTCATCSSTQNINTTIALQYCMECSSEMSIHSTTVSIPTKPLMSTVDPILFPTYSNISIKNGIQKAMHLYNLSYILSYFLYSLYLFA